MFRGSKIRFMILPGMLKNAPCLRIYKVGEELGPWGKTVIIRAQAGAEGRGRGRGGDRGGLGFGGRGGGRGGDRGGDRGDRGGDKGGIEEDFESRGGY